MPLPNRREKETREQFVSRCMSDETVKKEFPDQSQRVAVCLSQSRKENSKSSILEDTDLQYSYETYGFTEDLNEDNFYIPSNEEYIDFGEETLEWDCAKEKPGLWENIRKKKEREGKKYKPAKPGDPDRPSPEAYKKAQNSEYQGKKVTLNKPFRTPDGPKKFSVYVKNNKGNVVKVNFGSPDMEIKRDDPERRKSFRARHKCDTAKDKTTPRYWSCKQWRASTPVED